jgi:hypothetical protein
MLLVDQTTDSTRLEWNIRVGVSLSMEHTAYYFYAYINVSIVL